MPPLGQLPRVDVLLPGLVGDDQRDFRMRAQNLDGLVAARIVIGDDRVDLAAEIIERVGQDQRLVADARHGHEQVLLAEQGSVAGDDPLGIANLPIAVAHDDPARELLHAAQRGPSPLPQSRAYLQHSVTRGRFAAMACNGENGGCARLSLCHGAAMPIVVGTGTPNDKAWTWTDGKTYRADYEHDALSRNLKPPSGTEWTKRSADASSPICFADGGLVYVIPLARTFSRRWVRPRIASSLETLCSTRVFSSARGPIL